MYRLVNISILNRVHRLITLSYCVYYDFFMLDQLDSFIVKYFQFSQNVLMFKILMLSLNSSRIYYDGLYNVIIAVLIQR